MLISIFIQVAVAQESCGKTAKDGCPTLAQATRGMISYANMTVTLVNNASSKISWVPQATIPNNPNDPINATATALSNWLTVPGNQQDWNPVTINNSMQPSCTNNSPSDCQTYTNLELSGSVQAPAGGPGLTNPK